MELPSKEADCEVPITEEAANVTEDGPLWSKALEAPFSNQGWISTNRYFEII
jgi:hypothetical protein